MVKRPWSTFQLGIGGLVCRVLVLEWPSQGTLSPANAHDEWASSQRFQPWLPSPHTPDLSTIRVCMLVSQSCPTLLWPHGLQPTRLLRNLVGYSPWGCKELDKTEQLTDINLVDLSLLIRVWTWVLGSGSTQSLTTGMLGNSHDKTFKIDFLGNV